MISQNGVIRNSGMIDDGITIKGSGTIYNSGTISGDIIANTLYLSVDPGAYFQGFVDAKGSQNALTLAGKAAG